MPQCILDRIFLLRRAMRDNTLPFTDVVVLTLLNAGLLLHLCDVERRNLEAIFIADIDLYIIVCGSVVTDFKFLYIQIHIDMAVGFYPT